MLISEIEEALLDEYDPPPPYEEEEEEYDVFLFWPSYSPSLLIPAPRDAELDAFAVRGCPVAAPERSVAGLWPHHFSANNNHDAPPTSSRLSTTPPYFHLSFPTSHQRRAVEFDGLALPPRNLENFFAEEPVLIADDASQQLVDMGYNKFFCSGLMPKVLSLSHRFTKRLDTLCRKIQQALKTLKMTRLRRGA